MCFNGDLPIALRSYLWYCFLFLWTNRESSVSKYLIGSPFPVSQT
jgi:hypothetical protein